MKNPPPTRSSSNSSTTSSSSTPSSPSSTSASATSCPTVTDQPTERKRDHTDSVVVVSRGAALEPTHLVQTWYPDRGDLDEGGESLLRCLGLVNQQSLATHPELPSQLEDKCDEFLEQQQSSLTMNSN